MFVIQDMYADRNKLYIYIYLHNVPWKIVKILMHYVTIILKYYCKFEKRKMDGNV